MKLSPDTYSEVRTLTPDLGEFTVSGCVDEVELALKSFPRLREVSASTFDRAAQGNLTRLPVVFGRELHLGRLSIGLA